MKIWQFVFVNDGDTEHESFHDTKEAAERRACMKMIEIGIDNLDTDDDEDKEFVSNFLDALEAGDFGGAVQYYVELAEKNTWNEKFDISFCEVETSHEIPILKEALDCRKRWSGEAGEEAATNETAKGGDSAEASE